MAKAATKKVEEFTAEAKKTVEQGVEKMTRGVEEMNQFSQDNIEALVASSKTVAKAAEDINAEIMAYSKRAYEDSMAAAKEMTAVKSVTELFERQTAFAKASFETYVAEATKLNDLYSEAAKGALEPISARMTAASEMVKGMNA